MSPPPLQESVLWGGGFTDTYTLAWGFFLEKSQARPRSEIRTWPCSSSRILAGWWRTHTWAETRRERVTLMMEDTRDKITSVGNNDGDLTNSQFKSQFPLTRRKLCVDADNKRKAPVLVILCCLANLWLTHSPSPPTLSPKVLSASSCTVYWSPKTVPWLPAKYFCYYGNQSKQGNWRENRGGLKTWLIWIYGFENSVCGDVLVLHRTVMFRL